MQIFFFWHLLGNGNSVHSCGPSVIFTYHLSCFRTVIQWTRHQPLTQDIRRFALFQLLLAIMRMIYDNERLLQMVLNRVSNSLQNTLSAVATVRAVYDTLLRKFPIWQHCRDRPVSPLSSHLFNGRTSSTIKQCQQVYCKYALRFWKWDPVVLYVMLKQS